MITYEPPEQATVNVGDYIEGIGTVLDPDDEVMSEFLRNLKTVLERDRELSKQHTERILKENRTKVESLRELVDGDNCCTTCHIGRADDRH